MGGSGNRSQRGKITTNDMGRLDVLFLYQQGLPVVDCITLKYRVKRYNSVWEDKEFTVALEWTPCHFGGQRPWFLCPHCGRRVAVLYADNIFACRHCHNLAYDSQRQERYARLLSRMHKVRKSLGWQDEYGFKPKGMHCRTFERLTLKHAYFRHAALVAIADEFNISIK